METEFPLTAVINVLCFSGERLRQNGEKKKKRRKKKGIIVLLQMSLSLSRDAERVTAAPGT